MELGDKVQIVTDNSILNGTIVGINKKKVPIKYIVFTPYGYKVVHENNIRVINT